MKTPSVIRLRGAVLAGWALTAGSVMSGDVPLFQPSEVLQANGATLAPGSHAIPCVVDWNGDGRKDLLVGFRTEDKIALYLNCGTGAQPAFTNFTRMQAAGADIHHPASGCGAPAPWVCDYDNDGRKDLLVGTGDTGNVYFYRNTNTEAQPLLATGVLLLANGSPLSVTYRATPFVHDWNEDGLPDLLCGNGNGNVYYFRNAGSLAAPAYTTGTLLYAGGGVVSFGYRSAVRVHDWDGDGLKDLVGSAGYNVSWCRNTGSNPSPTLEAPTPVQAPLPAQGLAPISTTYRMRLELTDWNNDGLTDLLVGDSTGFIYYYEAYRFRFTGIEALPGNLLGLQWRSAPYLSYRIWSGGSPENLSDRAATNLSSEGNVTGWTNTVTGAKGFFRVEMTQ
jgi:hypothetical protein